MSLDLPLFAEEPAPRPALARAPLGHWWAGPIAGLDFETTSTDPLTARPVSVALLVAEADGARLPINLHALVRCGVAIPADAQAVHGITEDRLEREGVDVREVFGHLLETLAELAAAEIPVVIMNARFDWPLLHVEAARHGLTVPTGVSLLDPGVLDRQFDKYRRGSRKLSDLAARYDVPLDDAHEAAADVLAAIGVTRALARLWPTLQRCSLAQLQVAQSDWFDAWSAGCNGYWARTGRADRIEGGWPWGTMTPPAPVPSLGGR